MKTESALSLDELEQLEALCLRHENATSESDSNLEVLLVDVTGVARRYFLQELLWQDIEKRQRLGGSVSSADYSFTGADDLQIVKDVFEELDRESKASDSEKTELPDRYQKMEEIGAGGIGAVWRVFDNRAQRPLAVKALRSKFRHDRQANIRLEREAILTGALQHPGVPPVHDHGQLTDRSVFFVMKLIDGQTLAEILENQSSENSDLQKKIGIFEKVAQTMAYVHSQNVIHRDLKPQNIMVGKFAEVQVMDWGMAKRLNSSKDQSNESYSISESDVFKGNPKADVRTAANETLVNSNESSIKDRSLTRFGDVLGTPRYMAPEQARGELGVVDARADVFSMGSILFEILTGKRLYDDIASTEILAKVAGGNLDESFAQLESSTADAKLVSLCRSCLSPVAADRPENAGVIAHEIGEHFANVQQRVKAAEIELRETEVRAKEELKRRKTFTRMMGLVCAVFAVGLAAVIWQWGLAKSSEKKAEASADLADRRFFLAKDTVDNFYKDLSENELLKETPGAEALRKSFLEKVKAYYVGFVKTNPDDAQLKDEIAKTYFAIGDIDMELGSGLGSIEPFELSMKFSKELLDAEEELADTRSGLLASLHRIATVYHIEGEFESCIQSGKLGISQTRQMMLEDPENEIEYQNILSKFERVVARSYREAGNFIQAKRFADLAIETTSQLVEASPDDPKLQLDLSELLADAAQTAFAVEDDTEKALQLLRKANAINEKFDANLEQSFITKLNLARATPDFEESETVLKKLVSDLEQGCTDNPQKQLSHYQLSFARNFLTSALQQIGKFDESIAVANLMLNELDPAIRRFPDSTLILAEYPSGLSRSLDIGRWETRRDELLSQVELGIEYTSRLINMRPEMEAEAIYWYLHFADAKGQLLFQKGEMEDALLAWDAGVDRYDAMVERGIDLGYRHEETLTQAGSILIEKGSSYRSSNQPNQAIECFLDARKRFKEFASGDPKHSLFAMASSLGNGIGRLHFDVGEYEKAIEWLGISIEELQKSFEVDSEDTYTQNSLAFAMLARADAKFELGRWSDGQADLDELEKLLIRIRESEMYGLVSPLVKLQQCRLQVETGNTEAALADAIQFSDSKSSDCLVAIAEVFGAALRVTKVDNDVTQANKDERIARYSKRAAELITRALDKNEFHVPELLSPKTLPLRPQLKEILKRPELKAVANRIERDNAN